MTLSYSRLFQCATLLAAMVVARASFSQSSLASPTSDSNVNVSSTLPDSPSFSSSVDQNPTPATTQAQAPATPPANETPEQKKAREDREEAEREVKEQLKQRIGGVMPDFTVVMNGVQTVPLTPRQKFVISFHTIIDPYTIGLAAFVGGGYGELTDDHTGYGHGPAGYFKRTAASYADNVIGNVIGNAMLPIVLHQDPRYFRKGSGSIKSRIVYSALTTFICHSDAGKLQFNTSNVLGNFISGAISNAYYPDDERGFGLTMSNATVVTLEGMLGAQLLEFSPDITEYIHKRREHHRMVLQQKIDANAAAKMANPPAAPKQ